MNVTEAALVANTPVERHGPIWLKRDDLFTVAGVHGGKVRTCWALATARPDITGLVTASSRMSPQAEIVANVAADLSIECHLFMPWTSRQPMTPIMIAAEKIGACFHMVRPGHNSVIKARAREFVAYENAFGGQRLAEIPFGMECAYAVRLTAAQVGSALRVNPKRIVVPVGSAMSLAGILHGMRRNGSLVPVLGVQVGADPSRRLDTWAPADWRSMVGLVPAGIDYHQPAPVTEFDGVPLDPIYEAKCLPFLEPGDLLWVVGRRLETVVARR